MYGNNPYAQGGWPNPQNPQSINGPSWSTPPIRQPSIFGALPMLDGSSQGQPKLLTFRLESQYQDILNCSLYGPTGKPYIEIFTDISSSPAYTYFRKADGTTLAVLEWCQQSTVTISGILSKRPLSQWLPLTPDKRRRTMFCNNRPYTWVPQNNEILLYSVGSVNTEPLARISRQNGAVLLKLSAEAFTAGLLEITIVAAVALQSGKNID
ncbi:hypothetical protein D9613_007852 [Agrocybe pediades]|uniref:DUF6593 domain-containing protein n=1 Tax=Agrocybe pediades TaxID=84607 RepID=A0A8H4VMM6_9AGAR|nr:hypothetical protein D9613_007852 [Agrocybe pediades]KAF9561984.1 hypothetical protein CPC08DRAFT_400186 [Agrocybe pediades]